MSTPLSVCFQGSMYSRVKIFPPGGGGISAVYSNGPHTIVVKQSEPRKAGETLSEIDTANEIEKKSRACMRGAKLLRVPWVTKLVDGKVYSVYPYYEDTLKSWIRRHPQRTTIEVLSIVSQLFTVFKCLDLRRSRYTDLKGENLLVTYTWERRPGSIAAIKGWPRIVIGDLGGVTTERAITTDEGYIYTPKYVPEVLREGDITAKKLDSIASLLLGQVISELVFEGEDLERLSDCYAKTHLYRSCSLPFRSSPIAPRVDLETGGVLGRIALRLLIAHDWRAEHKRFTSFLRRLRPPLLDGAIAPSPSLPSDRQSP